MYIFVSSPWKHTHTRACHLRRLWKIPVTFVYWKRFWKTIKSLQRHCFIPVLCSATDLNIYIKDKWLRTRKAGVNDPYLRSLSLVFYISAQWFLQILDEINEKIFELLSENKWRTDERPYLQTDGLTLKCITLYYRM